ncbi:T9SS type A sorting domain-containing protein [Xylanibacter muris]|uniref:T9SS type A sorting domain-containing protein n=1 Tax=Xylanibacter muris TaxID=2736290 RepID=A0ABX2AQ82_9BACT|nr:T9SS type A sorting domain-containing protein [Xylanibacter muris]NPD93129.1 T9SS type A sorting domain-containing protein [Xylanibacter muris]
MRKSLLILSFISLISMVFPLTGNANESDLTAFEHVQEDNITITVEQSVIRVNGAAGMTLEVVSLTGKKVASVKIEGPAQRIELNLPKGCYILKVGKVVRKISVR